MQKTQKTLPSKQYKYLYIILRQNEEIFTSYLHDFLHFSLHENINMVKSTQILKGTKKLVVQST